MKKRAVYVGAILLIIIVLLSIGTEAADLGDSAYETVNFRIMVNTIDRRINLGEEVFENVLVVNTAKKNATVGMSTNMSVLIDKELVGIISTNDKVEIPAFESRNVIIKIKGLKEGIYLGNVYFFGEKIVENWIDKRVEEEGYNISVANFKYIREVTITNTSYVLPVRVFVGGNEPKLVDLKVVLDRINVLARESVGFEVSAFNLGSLEKYEIGLRYEVVDSEGNVVASKQESAELKNALSIKRKLELPKELEAGEYELILRAFYNERTVIAKERFNLANDKKFSPALGSKGFFFRFFSVYLSFILAGMFVVILAIVGVYYFMYLRKRLFEKKIEEMKKQSIYVFPEFALLPKSRFAYIGMVADSNIKTYLDHTQLNRHTLIAGGTGCGKSVSGMLIVEELLEKKDCPVIVFDPTGQWTGFVKKNEDERMKALYKKFGIGGAKAFDANIVEINEETINADIMHYLNKKGLTIFKLDKLTPMKLDKFVEQSLGRIYKAGLAEKSELKSLIVLDEVHRLLPKYGGRRAYIKLEQAVREFRKWGIGLLMISQVLTDFKGAIRGNIGTEVQMRTLYEGDIKRVKERHGARFSNIIARLPVGLGMIESAEYNKGVPYFVEFRPLLHSQFKLGEMELKEKLRWKVQK